MSLWQTFDNLKVNNLLVIARNETHWGNDFNPHPIRTGFLSEDGKFHSTYLVDTGNGFEFENDVDWGITLPTHFMYLDDFYNHVD